VLNNTVYSCLFGFLIRPYVSASVIRENNFFANNGTTYVDTLNWNLGVVHCNLYFGGGTGKRAHTPTLDPLFNRAPAGSFGKDSSLFQRLAQSCTHILAIGYVSDPGKIFRSEFPEYHEEADVDFLRQVRGVSYDEFDLAMKPCEELKVASTLVDFLRQRNLL